MKPPIEYRPSKPRPAPKEADSVSALAEASRKLGLLQAQLEAIEARRLVERAKNLARVRRHRERKKTDAG